MMTSILGMNRVENSTRDGTDIDPMIGPTASPTKRSIPVHNAPPATWKKSSGQSQFPAIEMMRSTKITAATARPARGTMVKSGTGGGLPGGPAAVTGGVAAG